MTPTADDRQAIADLMTGWMHRDLAEWDRLRDLFHPDGRIEVVWFDGPASQFVDASAAMGASEFRTKHMIGSPMVRFSADGRRAVSETNAIIVGQNARLGLGCDEHSRFLDRVERRDGRWRILDRRCLYDSGTFTFPTGFVQIDTSALARYPREYAPLAYLLEASGYPIERTLATRGSDLERTLKQRASEWLDDVGSV